VTKGDFLRVSTRFARRRCRARDTSDCGRRGRWQKLCDSDRSRLRREVLGAEALQTRVSRSGTSAPRRRPLELVVTGDGKRVAPRERNSLRPAENWGRPRISGAATPRRFIRLNWVPADRASPALLDKNVAYATAGNRSKAVSILFISPTPADGGRPSRSIPGVHGCRRALPDAYQPDDLGERRSRDFSNIATPKTLPAVNTMLVMPPPGRSGFSDCRSRRPAQIQNRRGLATD